MKIGVEYACLFTANLMIESQQECFCHSISTEWDDETYRATNASARVPGSGVHISLSGIPRCTEAVSLSQVHMSPSMGSHAAEKLCPWPRA